MSRSEGISARAKLALSYAACVVLTGGVLLAIVWVYLLRYVPDGYIEPSSGFVPNRGDLLRAFAPNATLAMFFLLVIGIVGGWWLAGRMLAPLVLISDAANRAGQGSLSHRINMAGNRDEFRDLADVFDSMLAQLETQVAAQQRFAANASHELRTPLAISRTLLEVAQKDPDRDVEMLLSRLQQVNSRAIELADALLLMSQADRGLIDVSAVDLSLLAEEAAENLLPLAEGRSVALTVSGDPVRVVGSESLLMQMVVNLTHNAVVHNLPVGGTVAVHVGIDQDVAILRVENSGAVIEIADVQTLIEPFQRGGARTHDGARDHAGSGLGLAIVQNIVAAHHGTLALLPRPEGGLIVEVRLTLG